MKRIFDAKRLMLSVILSLGAAQVCAMDGSMRAPLLDEKDKKFTSMHDSPPEKGKAEHVAIEMGPIAGALGADAGAGVGLPVAQPERVVDPAQAVEIVNQMNAAAGAEVAEYDREDQTVLVTVHPGCCARMRDTIQQWLAGVNPRKKTAAFVFVSWLGSVLFQIIFGAAGTGAGVSSTWDVATGAHSARVLMPYPKKIKIPLLVLGGIANASIYYLTGAGLSEVLLGATWYAAVIAWSLVYGITDPDGVDARSMEAITQLPAPQRVEVLAVIESAARYALDDLKRRAGNGVH